ncbi:hypothetical protein B0H11DRAFT_1738479 [Mycena galericulata]|nr:hypothetical protein B0H11DRAFT_1738479 [Mycena galericulata]
MPDKKTVLITGCSAGGIGAAIAHSLAKRGHHIFATARNTSKISPELAALPNVTTLPLDVTSAASVAEAVGTIASVTQEKGARGLDILVNNAGFGYSMPLLDVDIQKAKELYDTNVWGALRTIQVFADLLIEKKGRIVNVSSVGAVVNTPWLGVYSSSKAALTSLSDILRLELAPFGVTVVTLMVGSVKSSFHANEPEVVLPSTSRYTVMRQTISDWATGTAAAYPKTQSPADFAESVVHDIVGSSKPAHVWKGPNAGTMKFLTRWLPTSIFDSMMSSALGLGHLVKSLQK